MIHFVLRLWLADRPGVLGKIATAIGEVSGDVEAIDILERGGGQAIDEIVVALPAPLAKEALVAKLGLIEGLGIEDIRPIKPGHHDAGTAALQSAANLVATPRAQRLDHFCEQLRDLVDATWAVALDRDEGRVLAAAGVVPDTGWLVAFFTGSAHLDLGDRHGSAPSDIVWATLEPSRIAVAAGRHDRPFHFRERQRVALLGQIVGSTLND